MDNVNATIIELTNNVNQIRPAMREMLRHARLLETELILIGEHLSSLERAVDAFEGTLRRAAEKI